ncbi:MAG TPA: hypothetical protein VJH69_02375 [Candidatus Paceibacterota bacterium]
MKEHERGKMARCQGQVPGGVFLVWKCKKDPQLHAHESGVTPILITAVVALTALVGVLGWQAASAIKSRGAETHYVADKPVRMANGATVSGSGENFARIEQDFTTYDDDTAMDSSDKLEQRDSNDFSQIGTGVISQIADTYSQLQQIGGYTPTQGERIAGNIASSLRAEVSYEPYNALEFTTDPDTSYKRMLAYRADLQIALQPLLSNSEPELEIFGRYIESQDKNDLKRLGEVATNYREAAANMKEVTVPRDALTYHMAVVNSLIEFASTLEAMAKNADDSMATLALLRAYNDGEQAVLTSFDSLARYQRQKAS